LRSIDLRCCNGGRAVKRPFLLYRPGAERVDEVQAGEIFLVVGHNDATVGPSDRGDHHVGRAAPRESDFFRCAEFQREQGFEHPLHVREDRSVGEGLAGTDGASQVCAAAIDRPYVGAELV